MADEKLNTGPAENISPEAAEPIATPEQAAASEPQQEQTGPAIPEPGDVVVSFDKINELISPLHGSAAIAKTQNWRRSIAAPCMRQAFLLFVRLCTCPCFSTMLFPRSIKAAST